MQLLTIDIHLNTKAVILFDLFLPHFLEFCFPASLSGKRGWSREEKVACRERMQDKMMLNPSLSWHFQSVVSGEMCHCWTLPSILLAGIENGA